MATIQTKFRVLVSVLAVETTEDYQINMPDFDTVAKFRQNIATQIEWSLNANKPIELLDYEIRAVNGRTIRRNVDKANTYSPLSRPRVLRESANKIAELETSVRRSHFEIVDYLKRRHGTTSMERIFPTVILPESWRYITKADAQEALFAFRDACAILPFQNGVSESAAGVVKFLSSATGRQFRELGHLHDVDLRDWNTDHGVLKNVLRKLGNPADWIQTWFDAHNPINVRTKRHYEHSFSIFVLNAVVAARKYRNNVWGSRKQWQQLGCEVNSGEYGFPVQHYFDVSSGGTEGDIDDRTRRSNSEIFRKVSFVYNISQVSRKDGRQYKLKKKVERRGNVDDCISKHDPVIMHKAPEFPYYDSELDEIMMPPKVRFQNRGGTEQSTIDYYATLLHEFVHWTGHEDRLDRPFSEDLYAFEELIAELGSGFLCARFRLANARRLVDGRQGVAAYINSWFESGKDPVDLLLDAAAAANRAARYLVYPADNGS